MKKITELRRELGISRSQLAQTAGISVRTLEAYEQGIRDIKKAEYEKVIKIAKELKVKPEEITGM